MINFLSDSIVSPDSLPKVNANSNTLQDVLNVGFAIAGALAVTMVVIAGFRYVRAGDNETILSESKRQLAHALVGLVITATAAAMVNFALSRAS